jgi:hypothetical protein
MRLDRTPGRLRKVDWDGTDLKAMAEAMKMPVLNVEPMAKVKGSKVGCSAKEMNGPLRIGS